MLLEENASVGHWQASLAVNQSSDWTLAVRLRPGALTMAKWWNWQTRDAQNVVPNEAWEFESPLGHFWEVGVSTRNDRNGERGLANDVIDYQRMQARQVPNRLS